MPFPEFAETFSRALNPLAEARIGAKTKTAQYKYEADKLALQEAWKESLLAKELQSRQQIAEQNRQAQMQRTELERQPTPYETRTMQHQGWEEAQPPVGNWNPNEYDPSSFAQFAGGGYQDPSLLRHYEKPDTGEPKITIMGKQGSAWDWINDYLTLKEGKPTEIVGQKRVPPEDQRRMKIIAQELKRNNYDVDLLFGGEQTPDETGGETDDAQWMSERTPDEQKDINTLLTGADGGEPMTLKQVRENWVE